MFCQSPDAPWLKGWIDNQSIPAAKHEEDTLVIRVSAYRDILWHHGPCLCARPGYEACQWCQQIADFDVKDIMDTWRFESINDSKVQGLIRVRSSDFAEQLLKASGDFANGSRWFVDVGPTILSEFPRQVAWVDWDGNESWDQHINRAKLDAPFGLVHGSFQVGGVRCAEDDQRLAPITSKWWLQTTPKFWDLDQATALAESLGFVKIEMLSKAHRRNDAAWLFMARPYDGLTCCQTQVEDHEIEVTQASTRKPHAQTIKILLHETRVQFSHKKPSFAPWFSGDRGWRKDEVSPWRRRSRTIWKPSVKRLMTIW